VGWGKNEAVAQALALTFDPPLSLPKFPVFPLGTMFWVRAAAMVPLWRRGFGATDFPDEPLPNDGTILHALERALPSVCEAAGYTWATVYRRGASW
jgi:lipopolysaccharide biosynthesis protein